MPADRPHQSRWRTESARRLRADQTSAEELLWRELRNRRLDGLKFRRQVPIAGHIVDFACLTARLTIEIDGTHHAEQAETDRQRRAKIEAAGYIEIRFSNEDVLGRPAWVVNEICRTLDTARNQPIRSAAPRFD